MVEQKNKLMMLVIALLCSITLVPSMSACIEEGDPEVLTCLVKELENDNVSFFIKNNTLNDTIYFSIFKQEVINCKYYLTSVYDVFCNLENPHTTQIRFLPLDSVSFQTLINEEIYSEESLDEVIANSFKYRFLLKAAINNDVDNIYNFYSNFLLNSDKYAKH